MTMQFKRMQCVGGLFGQLHVRISLVVADGGGGVATGRKERQRHNEKKCPNSQSGHEILKA